MTIPKWHARSSATIAGVNGSIWSLPAQSDSIFHIAGDERRMPGTILLIILILLLRKCRTPSGHVEFG